MKKIVMFMCVLFVLMPLQVFAHSKLTESTPEADSTIHTSPEQISLTFNTTISSASRITLLNESGEQLTLNDITVNDSTISGQPAEKLDNGNYTVTWNIIGADGHAVEGSIGFKVELEEEPEPTATTQNDAADADANDQSTNEPAETTTPTPAATADEQQANDSNQTTEKSKQPVWPYVVIGVVVVAIIGFALRKRK